MKQTRKVIDNYIIKEKAFLMVYTDCIEKIYYKTGIIYTQNNFENSCFYPFQPEVSEKLLITEHYPFYRGEKKVNIVIFNNCIQIKSIITLNDDNIYVVTKKIKRYEKFDETKKKMSFYLHFEKYKVFVKQIQSDICGIYNKNGYSCINLIFKFDYLNEFNLKRDKTANQKDFNNYINSISSAFVINIKDSYMNSIKFSSNNGHVTGRSPGLDSIFNTADDIIINE
jgi:hypothetical protein